MNADADRYIRQVNRIDIRIRLLDAERVRLVEKRELALKRLAKCEVGHGMGDNMQSDSGPDAARNPGVDTAAAVDRAQETGDQAAGVRRRHEADTKATSVLDGGES